MHVQNHVHAFKVASGNKAAPCIGFPRRLKSCVTLPTAPKGNNCTHNQTRKDTAIATRATCATPFATHVQPIQFPLSCINSNSRLCCRASCETDNIFKPSHPASTRPYPYDKTLNIRRTDGIVPLMAFPLHSSHPTKLNGATTHPHIHRRTAALGAVSSPSPARQESNNRRRCHRP